MAMPSLRKRVSTYLRQLSFHNESRDRKHNVNENSFITKYLQGYITLKEGPTIVYGKIPTDLPNYELGLYETGFTTIKGCYSGPNGGLTTVKRTEKHLSVLDPDIDFIDTQDENVLPTVVPPVPRKSPQRAKGQPVDNTTMVIKVAGQEYCVTNRTKKRHNKSHSLGSISDFDLEIEKTKIDRDFYSTLANNNSVEVRCKNSAANDTGDSESSSAAITSETIKEPSKKESSRRGSGSSGANRFSSHRSSGVSRNSVATSNNNNSTKRTESQQGYGLAKSKSDGDPFRHRKRGKIIKIAQRPNSNRDEDASNDQQVPSITVDDTALPREWSKKSELVYGISDSLYDRNQVTMNRNGDPIADCFGVISRGDSAILAVADGVNWGEKASVAAKSAVHGCLHYLNKTVFADTRPFDDLTVKADDTSTGTGEGAPTLPGSRVANTREIFVCLLRAFSCAHDLILENQGMLTTLTVAVVLPLRQRSRKTVEEEEGGHRGPEQPVRYVCCVCNVGDTLAYVYSQKYGLRELTKGSHDINCNRDMRDALGALGPVDGINPELSNLTLSITTLHRGDIVLVASDGLTDNFDPNVCRFTVNSNLVEPTRAHKTSNAHRPSSQISSNAPTMSLLQPSTNNPPASSHHSHHTASHTTLNSPSKGHRPPVKPPRKAHTASRSGSSKSSTPSIEETKSTEVLPSQTFATGAAQPKVDDNLESNPLVAQFVKDNAPDSKRKTVATSTTSSLSENKASSLRQQVGVQTGGAAAPSSRKTQSAKKPDGHGYKFLRSKTTIEMRSSASTYKQILRNEDGIPYVTPIQRYELQLLLIEDVLRNGISGSESPTTAAKRLCENLVNFTFSITSAKRHTLEDPELYFDNRNGLMVEVSQQEKKLRRKRVLEKVQNLPGKLDHVSVVAWNVGSSY